MNRIKPVIDPHAQFKSTKFAYLRSFWSEGCVKFPGLIETMTYFEALFSAPPHCQTKVESSMQK